ncbi:MAG: 4-(cytidine 5'-diphospho)-2-C-methyl-D-erythritol kinase [Actinobacteria bacterium]|jgi:4-diphosphocytidyl-2-C-methyl-D-erythritol kinase|uniref:4-(cytidine 5'-diphospho)-2-C-methyl-D-erythritol kinase n=1 Tax=freshwater metagenome TaxID=449393 RepID=A0A6J6FD04_9ZZZZ|nr:4-(cytidine 5'-diphospho)-2-C-methyl-D-erythritol kinase [Actinomycetota bacterium]MSX27424.1 4-(cytidine 5'-diphospho)-2-C-methyl-D-erythritol kinase [Actinomycetota bacterium]MSY10803.1 4-(cytidine 5'-diphospho)-2-C-methyl-D-erythritol kinase [Actinomycetota bacterium]MTA34803.1 4-(cytidine 5'-diphospho)-2-C-methyl-D-erythritol kinase [Actinomycetota bacterium]
MRSRGVIARVPAKVNLQLSVGPLGSDGYHEVITVFQAISLFDDVSVATAPVGNGLTIDISGQTSSGVPADSSNLAIRAADLMIKTYDLPTDLVIKLKKEIPVAGGMAGGSADAAGVIVGLDSLFELGLSRDEMESVGSKIGSDVPFSICGGVAIGSGRGDQITPALAKGNYFWVLALSGQGLATPSVYQECDRLREGLSIATPQVSEPLMQALRAGDAKALGKSLSNDLQSAACSLRPALRLVLDVGVDYGALGGIVSGSGPTVAFLVSSDEHAMDLTVALSASGVVSSVVRATGPVPGARIIESF